MRILKKRKANPLSRDVRDNGSWEQYVKKKALERREFLLKIQGK
jgi:hypothetical protein